MPDPATDAQTPQEVDLEQQVEGLLSEISETVEDINRRLDPEPELSGEIAPDAVIDDTGSTQPPESVDTPPPPESPEPPEPPEPAEVADMTESIDSQDSPNTEAPESVQAEAPEAEDAAVATPPESGEPPQEASEDESLPESGVSNDDPEGRAADASADLGAPIASDTQPIPDDVSQEPEGVGVTQPEDEREQATPEVSDVEEEPSEADPSVVLDEVQSALEEAVAESTPEPAGAGAIEADPDLPEPGVDAGTDENDAADDESEAIEDAEETDDAAAEPAVPEYGDIDSLDDELAALAADALDDDLGGDFETEATIARVETEPEPAPDTPEEGSVEEPVVESPEPVEPVGQTAPAESEPAPASTDTDGPLAAEPQTEQKKEAEKPKPAPKATPDPATLRWGWLPPKPEWEEVYSKGRVAIIAWRHAAWVIPPLLAMVGRRLRGLFARLEPMLLRVATAVASPLTKRDARTRSVVGWFALYTFFCAACLWAYVLWGRSPTAPEASGTPVMLEGENAVASSEAAP